MIRRALIVLALVGLHKCLVLDTQNQCDSETCTGPVYYYRELGCTPIYQNSSSCCPIRYNCDYWKNLPDDKCFINGREYKRHEILPIGELGSECFRCICGGGTSSPACLSPSCMGSGPGCYRRQTIYECCPTVEVCPEKAEDIPICIVDGKTYKDGEAFTPLGEPEKKCYCGEGYTGQNVEPFCMTHNPGWCGNALNHVNEILQNCAPVYGRDRSPLHHCNYGYVCYDGNADFATTIHPNNGNQPSSNFESCIFGNVTVQVGGTFTQSGNGGRRVECVCEVPPVVTCRYSAHD